MSRITSEPANVLAFLDMLAQSEGTAAMGDDGYNVIVGSLPDRQIIFRDYARHPNVTVQTRYGWSTAAGRYQFIHGTWTDAASALALATFGPEQQDQAAVLLIKRRKGYDALLSGDITSALLACGKEWASLPANAYGQAQRSVAQLRGWYTAAGGTIA